MKRVLDLDETEEIASAKTGDCQTKEPYALVVAQRRDHTEEKLSESEDNHIATGRPERRRNTWFAYGRRFR